MAQIGFGINTNDTAQESGYDQFTLGLGETLKAVAAENWKFNPLSSISTYRDLQTARDEAFRDKSPLLNRQDLNTEYKDLGLFFEQDEPQSVVDLIVNQKRRRA